MDLFDTRLYRTLGIFESANSQNTKAFAVKPLIVEENGNHASFVGDYYETPASVELAKGELDPKDPDYKSKESALNKKRAKIEQRIKDNYNDALAPFSTVHPYALIKLAGASGSKSMIEGNYLIDQRNKRKWYEIDGTDAGGYARNPSTTVLINWANQDPYGRTPYSFQDFVYCKWWNKIQNNRMITLRRYSTPVNDALKMMSDPGDGEQTSGGTIGKPYQQAMSPVVTAVTYFGEGTGNSLSDLMSFTVGYNWKDVEGNVWNTSASQNNEGQGLALPSNRFVQAGLSVLTRTLGFIDDYTYQKTDGKEGGPILNPMNAAQAPPDPYNDGPYSNRIIGPVNVINSVKARDRGLKFTQDGLSITFEYVARPIANINNKAIMLDLLANMLMMTSSKGTFWGGIDKYYVPNPAMYPWRRTDILNNLYKGNLFGKKSVYTGLMETAYKEPANFFVNFAKDIWSDIKGAASNILNQILGKPTQEPERQEQANGRTASENTLSTLSRMVSGHFLKGASIPFIQGMRSILTGEPTGEWHLTIGNPLNPIAMIGNLIVEDAKFEFSNELGPDDFPISFKCVVNLKHALGRDKEGVESMFNRGYGRIYSLPLGFATSADGESTVDKETGRFNPDAGKDKFSMTYALIGTSANMFALQKTDPENKALKNSGSTWDNNLSRYVLDPTTLGKDAARWNPGFLLIPSQAHWLL